MRSIEWLDGVPDTYGIKDLAPLQARTQDGLSVNVGIVVQYKLVKEKVPDMYQQFRDSYESYFVSNFGMAFQEVISRHPSSDLWQRRLSVTQEFETVCTEIAATRLQGFITCIAVQLSKVALDPSIEEKLEQRQIQVQLQSFHFTARTAKMIRAQTAVNQSMFDKEIVVVNAAAAAKAYSMRNAAIAAASKRTQVARAEGLELVRAGLTNNVGAPWMGSLDMIKYTERTALEQNDESMIVYSDASKSAAFVGAPPSEAKGGAASSAGPRRLEAKEASEDFGRVPTTSTSGIAGSRLSDEL